MGTSERYRLVVQLARDLTARRDLDDVLAATLQGLHRLVDFSGGSIQLLDDDGYIRLAASDPPASDDARSLRVPLGSSVAGRILLTEQPVYIPDLRNDPDVTQAARRGHVSTGVRAYYGVPLLAEGRAIGLLQIDGPEPDPWGDDERLVVLSIAPVVAAAIQNARAHTLQRAASEWLRDIEARHAEVERIVNDELRAPAAALVRDAVAAAAASDDTSVSLGELIRRIRDQVVDLTENLAALSYIVHAQRVPASDTDVDRLQQQHAADSLQASHVQPGTEVSTARK